MRGQRVEVQNCDDLKNHLNTNSNKDVKLKLLFINSFLINNNDIELTCKSFHISIRTGYEWIDKWNKNGVIGLKDKPITGRKAKISIDQLKFLTEQLKKRNFWDISEIQKLVNDMFNVCLSNKRLSVILREIKMNYTKPYKLDYRRPDNAEEILINSLSKISEQMTEDGIDKDNILIGFMDEASPQNKANSGKSWSFNSPIMKENSTKYKANTIAFYALNGNDTIMFLEDSKEEGIAEFIKEIRVQNPDPDAIVVVLDNFSSHKTELCKKVARDNGIYLVFIPPYSPDLNPIEFIWKSVRRSVSKFFIKSENYLRDIIVSAFSLCSQTISFADSWIKKIASSIDFLQFLNC
jgi:transposase